MSKAMISSILVSLHRRTVAGPLYVKLWRCVTLWPFLYDLMSFQVIILISSSSLAVVSAACSLHWNHLQKMCGYSGLQVNFGHGTKHFCMPDFCFIFCENGHNYSEQWVAAPYQASIFFSASILTANPIS